MIKTHATLLRAAVGICVAATIMLLVDCSTSTAGGQRKFSGSSTGSLVYVTSEITELPVVTVHTSGIAPGIGDQVAWAVLIPKVTINSITPAPNGCGGVTTTTWTPFQPSVPNNNSAFAWSGPFSDGTEDPGTYYFYYKVNLSSGNGPCGHIIIIKP